MNDGPTTEKVIKHLPSLMRSTLREWIDGGALDPTPLRELRCQECGREARVDLQLAERGDYFCDGEGFLYRKGDPSIPSITEVFPETFGLPLRARVELRNLAAKARSLADSLENWLYENTVPDDDE